VAVQANQRNLQVRKRVDLAASRDPRKGGNLLLNVGPKPDGELPIEQEDRLREIALWMFVNSECIHGVRPWIITNEGETWFTKKKDANTVYAILKTKEPWKFGTWKEIVLKSVQATAATEVSVLCQNDKSWSINWMLSPRPPSGNRRRPACPGHERAAALHQLPVA